ncbi:MAG: hypothetical protein Greene101415_220 [Parcubacteria group bacterium Greene1014_15]|nr:MAG: hypothetical protein Greene101415_220 [Parcubacteria group bacterium Greene1014_15]
MRNIEKLEKFDEIENAYEMIRTLFEQGEKPVVTVPRQYVPMLRRGIRESSSWIGGNIVAGTIGRDPYMPPGEDRALLRISIDSIERLEPRLTGPDQAFHGIVVFKGPIFPDQIEIIEN